MRAYIFNLNLLIRRVLVWVMMTLICKKNGTNQSFAQRKVLSFDKICFCVPTQVKFVKKKQEKFAGMEKLPYLCSVILKTIFLP